MNKCKILTFNFENDKYFHSFFSYNNAMLASFQHNRDYSVSSYRTERRTDYHNHMIDMKRAMQEDPLYTHIYKIVSKVTGGIANVAKDFWWDMGNDKLGYSIKLFAGTTAGLLGGITGGPVGIVAGGLFGFSVASAAHYTERRFFDKNYKKKKEEIRKIEAKRREKQLQIEKSKRMENGYLTRTKRFIDALKSSKT